MARLRINFWTEEASRLAILLFALSGVLLNVAEQIAKFPLLKDAGYPDSYVLYDIQHFQRTGVIYRDLSQPPAQPAQYSPLLYVVLALPGSVFPTENPFIGPRLIVLAAYLSCVVITASIARSIIPLPSTWLWGIMLGGSITSMTFWILQLRGDFLGILFELLTIRLLLSPSRWTILMAGICAGLALQFKITMLAAVGAGTVWLLLKRNWPLLLQFVLAGAMTFAGFYFFFSLRQPRMLQQITTFSSIIPEYREWIHQIGQTLREPVPLLALAALPMIGRHWQPWRRWKLLLLFSAISFCIAGLTAVHAGANLNYFFEFLFSVIPLAVFAVLHLKLNHRQWKTCSVFLAGLIGFYIVLPILHDLWSLRERISPSYIRSANERMSSVRAAFLGRHIFSTVPYVAILDPQPIIIEPVLFSYLQRLGKIDPIPVMKSVQREEFEAVVTDSYLWSYRGIDKISPLLRRAIISGYAPQCEFDGLLVHLPRETTHSVNLRTKLQQIGCRPVLCESGGRCPLW